MVNEQPKNAPKLEVASNQKDIDLFYGWITRMENPDMVVRLEGRGRGVKIYEDLLREWQVHSMLQTRSLALQACEWQVEAASESGQHKKEAELVRVILKEANFDRLTGDLMEGVITGYKPVEIMWDASEGQTWVKEFRGRRPSRFIFDMDGRLRLLTIENNFDGVPIPPRKFVTWTYGGYDCVPYGMGLGYQLYWPCWFKKHDIKFWLTYCEKFGSPTAIGKHPAGASEAERNTLLAALDAIQQETGITIPQEMAIEFLEAKRSGGANSYEQLVQYLDRAIAKTILGTVLTSELGKSGMGSAGMAMILDQVRQDILKSDADSMCETINRTAVRWITDFNFPQPAATRMRLYPKVWRRTGPEKDLVALAARDKVICVDMGMGNRIPESYIADTYGIVLAQKGEPVIGVPGPKAGAAATDPTDPLYDPLTHMVPRAPDNAQQYREARRCPVCHTQPSVLSPQSFFSEGSPDPIDTQIDRLSADSLPMSDALLGPIRDLVMTAKSLDEIRDGLLDLYGKMDPAALGALIERAMTAADLLGICEVQDGD